MAEKQFFHTICTGVVDFCKFLCRSLSINDVKWLWICSRTEDVNICWQISFFFPSNLKTVSGIVSAAHFASLKEWLQKHCYLRPSLFSSQYCRGGLSSSYWSIHSGLYNNFFYIDIILRNLANNWNMHELFLGIQLILTVWRVCQVPCLFTQLQHRSFHIVDMTERLRNAHK